jgi:hypothetical protein
MPSYGRLSPDSCEENCFGWMAGALPANSTSSHLSMVDGPAHLIGTMCSPAAETRSEKRVRRRNDPAPELRFS